MRPNTRGMSGVTLARAWLVGAVCVLGLFQSTGCSDDFATCDVSKTCPKSDAGATGGEGGGSNAGASGVAGKGASGGIGSGAGGKSAGGSTSPGGVSGNGGGATDATGGTPNGGGGASTTPDGGSIPDASTSGGEDAHVTPSCTKVDGGTSADPDHCGSCSLVCSAAGTASRACVEGACKPVCQTSFLDCNKDGKDGCEVNSKSDPDHCGLCTTACSATGTTARACTLGVCKPTCDATHADCNLSGTDGCEINFKTDPNHCGSCSKVCATTGTSAQSCVDGVCKPTCDASHVDCNKDGSDGCEVDVKNSPDNCGACGYACSGAQVAAGQRLCVAGACAPGCAAGYGNCDSPAPGADDGCETLITTSLNCGACNHSCLGGACSALTCQEFVIDSGLKNPASLTVSDAFVYYIDGGTTDGRVMRRSLTGLSLQTVASAQALPWDIENDGLYVYWTNAFGGAPSINRSNINGTPTTKVLTSKATDSNIRAPLGLAVDGTNVYWGDYTTTRVFRIVKDGSADAVIMNDANLTPTDVIVDGSRIFFSYYGGWGILPVGATAATPQLFQVLGNSNVLALDGTSLFFRSPGTVSGTSAFSRIPAGSVIPSQAVIAADVNPNDNAFAVDATYLYYWSDALYRVAKTGGTPQKLSPNVDNVVKILIHSENGGRAIYWLNQGDSSGSTGTVRKLAL
jgi:hypothetical protein